MTNKSNSHTEDEVYALIQSQSRKVVFLQNTIKLFKQDSPLPAYLENDLLEFGYQDLLDRIKTASKQAVLVILEEQLETEKEKLHELTRF